jgi:type I restriction enzyme S subunit
MCNYSKNWELSKIGECLMLIRGISFPKSAKNIDYKDGLIACLRTKNVQKEVDWNDLWFVDSTFLKREEQIIKKGDILISVSNSLKLLGKVSLIKSIPYVSTLGAFIVNLRVSELLNNKFIFYYLSSLDFKNNVKEKASTTTNISNISAGKLANIFIPIAPLNEQTRIVEKIEALFSDLDKATEDLKKTQEQVKIYRQAVLKAAFEGKLLEMSSAKYFPFSEVCDINPSKQEIVELNDDLEVTFLPMPAVSETGVILEKKIKKLKDVKKGYTFFKNGDVLLAKITPCFENGKKAIVKELKNNIGFGSTEFHVLRPKEEVISEWIYYGVSLEDFRNKAKSQMTGTAGQKRISKRVLESYVIPVPTKPIQEEIVKEIESRLSVCDKLEETVKESLNKIEYLRQSILKKAFEGKLVSQDPNDLPACELLKQIKIKKDKMSKNGK